MAKCGQQQFSAHKCIINRATKTQIIAMIMIMIAVISPINFVWCAFMPERYARRYKPENALSAPFIRTERNALGNTMHVNYSGKMTTSSD